MKFYVLLVYNGLFIRFLKKTIAKKFNFEPKNG